MYLYLLTTINIMFPHRREVTHTKGDQLRKNLAQKNSECLKKIPKFLGCKKYVERYVVITQ